MAVEAEAAVASSSISPWIGPSIQAGAIIISAIGVAFMIWTNRLIARQRAVLDLIVREQTDGDMIEARKRFVELKQKGNIGEYANQGNLASSEASDIRFILNMYEAVAIGIKKKAYDKDIYKDWCRTTAVKDWIACKEFVAKYQQDHSPKIYTEFEALAKEWATNDERKHI